MTLICMILVIRIYNLHRTLFIAFKVFKIGSESVLNRTNEDLFHDYEFCGKAFESGKFGENKRTSGLLVGHPLFQIR